MKNALGSIALTAVFACATARAVSLDVPAPSGMQTNTATPAAGSIGAASLPTPAPLTPTGGAPSLQSLGTAAPVPTKTVPKTAPTAAIAALKRAQAKAALSVGAPTVPVGASEVLTRAARGVESGRSAQEQGGDPDDPTLRAALDLAFDAQESVGDVPGQAATVTGRFAEVRDKVISLVLVANKAAPSDAPKLYRSAIQTAAETLPAAAASSVAKAVLAIAARKAQTSLSDLVSGAFSAAAAGQAVEADRFLKSLDAWEELRSQPERPLLANADDVERGVARALQAVRSGSVPSASRVWVEKRGDSYVAVLPDLGVEAVSGLAVPTLPEGPGLVASLAQIYGDFARGRKPIASDMYRTLRARGRSVPAAASSVGVFWLKSFFMRIWELARALLPWRGLPAVADASTLPRLRAAAESWTQAVALGEAAARQAGSPVLRVESARGAFTLALRAAQAHESLTGRSGAVALIAALSSEFENGVRSSRLSPFDSLSPQLEDLLVGEGGLRHWALRHAADARAFGAREFSSVRSKERVVVLGPGSGAQAAQPVAETGMNATAFGPGLWAEGVGRYGAATLAADIRSTADGGLLSVRVTRGTEELAKALDDLGFDVHKRGAGLTATLDADTQGLEPKALARLAKDAAALIMGAMTVPATIPAGSLVRLLADVRDNSPAAAAVAKSLDGRLLPAPQIVAWVGRMRAVVYKTVDGFVTALVDDAGLHQYARLEPLAAK